MDNKEKLYEDIKSVVAQIFSEKEEADKVKQTEEALQKSAATIEELTVALEASNDEVTELQEKLTASDAKVVELQTGLEAAQEELTTANQKISEAEAALEEIKKDRAAETRMSELDAAGVSRKDRESQSAKVREMSDEEFATYKDELVSIREAIVAELEAAKAKEEEDAVKLASKTTNKDEETASEEETAEEETDEETASEEETITPPANIDQSSAISAAMNLEVIPSKDLMTRYAKLGSAMAEAMKKSN
jgi:chromosome segregation ATPase